MTQPKYAPILQEDEARPAYRLDPPPPWRARRPGELVPGRAPAIAGGGSPGPDQGYALLLARRFADRLVLRPGERREDVLSGAVAIALRRASLLGRAPVAADISFALDLYGFLSQAPDELVAERARLFGGLAHDYARLRSLVASIPEERLRSPARPASAMVRAAGWAPATNEDAAPATSRRS